MNLFISPESDPSPAAYSTPSQSSASSARKLRPLSIAEKASPIQAITPDLRRGSLSSSQPSTKSPTPFSSLQGFHRDGSEIAQLALAMESLFDDDADHPQPAAAEISPLLEKKSEAVVFELSDDSFEGFASPERTQTEGAEEEPLVSFGHEEEEEVPPTSPPPPAAFRFSAAETNSERLSFPQSTYRPPSLASSYSLPPSRSPQEGLLPDSRGAGNADCEAWLETLSALSTEVSSSSLLSSVPDLRSQLQKLLLLPVERLQESVFRTVSVSLLSY